jgi:hypothetical protein
MDDRLEMHLLRREQRKAFVQIEAQLRAEDAQRPGAGAIVLARPVLEDAAHEIEIKSHGRGAPLLNAKF